MCPMFELACICMCDYCKLLSVKIMHVQVCEREKIPALSGVLSSVPNDEFSTVAGEVTTPLYTGHTLTPPCESLWE